MWTRKREAEESTLDMTPLVDVVFLLIVFFMLSTTFIVLPGIRIDLPKASEETIKLEKEKVFLSIDNNGSVYLGDKPMHPGDLPHRLKQVASEDPETVVVIKGDRHCVYGPIVDVLNTVHQAGLHRIAIVTEKKKEPDTVDKVGPE